MKASKAMKAFVFLPQEIKKFLKEAPDESFLATKAACILGVSGACRIVEIEKSLTENVQRQGKIKLVKKNN